MKVVDEVLEIIKAMPGVKSGEIVELMPHTNRQTVYATLNAQYIRGNILREKASSSHAKGRPTFAWRLNEEVVKIPPMPPRKVLNVSKNKQIQNQSEIDDLRRQIKELEEWKAEALSRYPDLAVNQIVLKARNIVAAELAPSDPTTAEAVRKGQRDGVLAMRLVIKMLEGEYEQ